LVKKISLIKIWEATSRIFFELQVENEDIEKKEEAIISEERFM